MVRIRKAVVLKAVKAALLATSRSPTSAYAQGKAFELKVLLTLLLEIRSGGYTLECQPHSKSSLTFSRAPCRPNGKGHDYITATKGSEIYEFWVSVEFTTLSYSINASRTPKFSDLHEIDIGLFKQLKTKAYPSYKKVILAASCKSGVFHKKYVREALGLRRELGFTKLSQKVSLAPWFEPNVPTDPPSILALFSDDLNCIKYQRSLDFLGLYIRHL